MIGASLVRLCARSHSSFKQLSGRTVQMRVGSSVLPLAKGHVGYQPIVSTAAFALKPHLL
jgi:hypothetical protein